MAPPGICLHCGHFYPGKEVRAFPLDGLEAVLRLWAEAIQHQQGSQGV